ncbi:MAG TPA: YqgE/AlgH family protein [Woeseiaceae bacterium]|nr:YqgE/AlgH family protein [Woeseiaceae bacterium]
MYRIAAFLALVAWLTAATANADQQAAAGKLLVATDEVRGEIFARTLILLLHFDEAGAMGLVVNRPTDVTPVEVMDDPAVLADYRGTLFWGGPVEMAGLRVLLRSDSAPEGATMVVDNVHLVPFDAAMKGTPADATSLRIYIGYAGWAAGQLDYELARGSWEVRAATDELVFADDPRSIWERLKPVREYRAAVKHGGEDPVAYRGR